jgi:hypothetical protein
MTATKKMHEIGRYYCDAAAEPVFYASLLYYILYILMPGIIHLCTLTISYNLYAPRLRQLSLDLLYRSLLTAKK